MNGSAPQGGSTEYALFWPQNTGYARSYISTNKVEKYLMFVHHAPPVFFHIFLCPVWSKQSRAAPLTVIIGVFAHCAVVVFLNVFVLRFLSHRGADTPICAKLPIPVRKLN